MQDCCLQFAEVCADSSLGFDRDRSGKFGRPAIFHEIAHLRRSGVKLHETYRSSVSALYTVKHFGRRSIRRPKSLSVEAQLLSVAPCSSRSTSVDIVKAVFGIGARGCAFSHFAVFFQQLQSANNYRVGIDTEVATCCSTGIRDTESIGTQRGEFVWNVLSDLVG